MISKNRPTVINQTKNISLVYYGTLSERIRFASKTIMYDENDIFFHFMIYVHVPNIVFRVSTGRQREGVQLPSHFAAEISWGGSLPASSVP